MIRTGECSACRKTERLKRDLIIPLAQGGDYTAANEDWLCDFCAGSKGAMTPEQWLKKLFEPYAEVRDA